MARLGGQAVAVPVGAGPWVGGSPAAEEHRLGSVNSPAGAHSLHPALPEHQLRHRLPEDLGPGGVPDQSLGDVVGAVRLGEHPPAPLHLQGDAQLLKKGHGVLGGKVGKGPVEELPSPGAGGHRLFHGAVVCHVAPAFPGDAQLSSQLLVLVEQGHGPAPLQQGARGHQSRGAAPHHQDVKIPLPAQLFFSSTFS